MKRLINTLAVLMLLLVTIYSCTEDKATANDKDQIAPEVLNLIAQQGFNTSNVIREGDGYIVEGDIFLSDKQLRESFAGMVLRVPQAEQYRTTNLVGGLPRTLRVGMSSTLPSAYSTAVNTAINRYNAENLRVKFQRVTAYPVDILITRAPSGASYLASAGFPSNGNPYNQILVNSSYLGSNPGTSYLATILAHEIGHCIGFRHTDYMDRSYSCGGSYYNEGASTVGAIHIPGTPTGPDPNSWMLACIGTGVNRPFNANDKVALAYIY